LAVKGNWDGYSSGCSKFKENWRNNPVFRLDVLERSLLQIVIDSEKVHSAVGYYVFTTKDGFSPLQSVGHSHFIKSRLGERALASKQWYLERSSYLIIPTTFESSERAHFDLMIYTTKEEKLRLIPLSHHTKHK